MGQKGEEEGTPHGGSTGLSGAWGHTWPMPPARPVLPPCGWVSRGTFCHKHANHMGRMAA
ncbi:MAG: hypothetical protein Q4F21_06915 [Lachnospiraceae bacterium]|nr:hypothetical protein [Lachnospiraceae bacterium]